MQKYFKIVKEIKLSVDKKISDSFCLEIVSGVNDFYLFLIYLAFLDKTTKFFVRKKNIEGRDVSLREST